MAGCGAGLAAVAWASSSTWLRSGALLFGAVFCAAITAVLLYRLAAEPVLVRIDDGGIYLKRLGVAVPWEALDRVERFTKDGEEMVELVERVGGHPVFETRSLALGAAANALAGLPPLCENLSGTDGTPDMFAAAVEAVGRVPLTDRG